MLTILCSVSAVLRERARQQPVDVDPLGAKFFDISPITNI